MILFNPKIIVGNNKQDFDTHLNYISCLKKLTDRVVIQHSQKLRKKSLPNVDKKDNLIKLTLKSLKDEYKIVQSDQEYSYASTSWLPIKSYYLLFNVLLTIEYIIQVKNKSFNLSHNRLVNGFTKKLEEKEIQFNKNILNQVFDKSIFNFRCSPGENLSKKTPDDLMYKLALRKIAWYKIDNWKEKQKIDLRKKEGRLKKDSYLNNFRVSIFDFPYYMRIRSNYKDFKFIERVSTFDTAKYFNVYFDFTMNFYKVLNNLKKDLIKNRDGK